MVASIDGGVDVVKCLVCVLDDATALATMMAAMQCGHMSAS